MPTICLLPDEVFLPARLHRAESVNEKRSALGLNLQQAEA